MQVTYDNWLDSFQQEIEKCKSPIIDLGCGIGNDTLYLTEKGKVVIPCDFLEKAILNIQNNFPQIARTECFDMTKGLPFEDNFTDVIICDLSLHYFTEQVTFEVLNEIKRVLKRNGILIFRVNSVKDSNYGAGEGMEIERHLYVTGDETYKRFFDLEDIKKFFAGWQEMYLNEKKMKAERYEHEKVTWVGAMKKVKYGK